MRGGAAQAVALLAATLLGCSSGNSGTTGGDGGDGLQSIPATNRCSGSANACLAGTLGVKSLPAPFRSTASLYAGFPVPGVNAVSEQVVAVDGTWAFSSLSPGTRYFVQIAAGYNTAEDGGAGTAIASTVGPLMVGASGPGTVVTVAPVQLSVLEGTTSTGSLVLQSALARVFDPATGAASTGKDTVTITVGGAPVAMPWTKLSDGQSAYFVEFATPPAAQPTYVITTSASGSYTLVGATPSFTPTVTAPATGATVPKATALMVTWPEQPTADGIMAKLYSNATGSWVLQNTSQVPLAPTATQTILPATDVVAGNLLLNVNFLVGNCPPSADGCVIAEAIAASQFSAQ